MSYIKANNILPDELVELIQEYIDGEYIYIPKKESNKKAWGTNTNTKPELEHRNNNIFNDYINGIKMDELTKKYFLSIKSIQRIIYYKKKSI